MENSPETRQSNRDVIHFGLADLGYLLTEADPGRLSMDAIALYCRSYFSAIYSLENYIGPEELTLRPAEETKTYSSLKNSYGSHYILKSSKVVEAGEELTFNPDRQIRTVIRRFGQEYLPKEQHYLPFSSESSRWLLLSADDIAIAHYRDKAEIFVPDLAIAR